MAVVILEEEIIQGDTGPLWRIGVPRFDADGNVAGYEDLGSFTCTLRYVDSDGVERIAVVTRKNTANDRFLCQLSSATTDAMPIGLNRVVWEIRNTNVTPPYVSEVQIDISLKPQRYSP